MAGLATAVSVTTLALQFVGALALISYGVIPTLQSSQHFGRVYAADDSLFIILSLLWRRLFDGLKPDRWKLLGTCLCLVGVVVIFFGPPLLVAFPMAAFLDKRSTFVQFRASLPA